MKLSYALSYQPTAFAAVGGGDLPAHVARMRSLGFDGVELAVRDPGAVTPEAIAALLGDDLALAALGTGQAWVDDGLSLSDPSAEIRGRALARLEGHLALAAAFAAPVVIGLIRGRVAAPETRAAQEAHFEEGLRRLMERAERLAVRVVLEPVNRYETNLVNTADEAAAVLDRVGSPRLGLLLDTFHMNIEEPRPLESIRRHGPRIGHVHIADSNRRSPGSGHIDFRAVRAALRACGYEGYLSGEMLPLPDLATAIGRFAASMREAGHDDPRHTS